MSVDSGKPLPTTECRHTLCLKCGSVGVSAKKKSKLIFENEYDDIFLLIEELNFYWELPLKEGKQTKNAFSSIERQGNRSVRTQGKTLNFWDLPIFYKKDSHSGV